MFTLGDVADILDNALDMGISIVDALHKMAETGDKGKITKEECLSNLNIPDVNTKTSTRNSRSRPTAMVGFDSNEEINSNDRDMQQKVSKSGGDFEEYSSALYESNNLGGEGYDRDIHQNKFDFVESNNTGPSPLKISSQSIENSYAESKSDQSEIIDDDEYYDSPLRSYASKRWSTTFALNLEDDNLCPVKNEDELDSPVHNLNQNEFQQARYAPGNADPTFEYSQDLDNWSMPKRKRSNSYSIGSIPSDEAEEKGLPIIDALDNLCQVADQWLTEHRTDKTYESFIPDSNLNYDKRAEFHGSEDEIPPLASSFVEKNILKIENEAESVMKSLRVINDVKCSSSSLKKDELYGSMGVHCKKDLSSMKRYSYSEIDIDNSASHTVEETISDIGNQANIVLKSFAQLNKLRKPGSSDDDSDRDNLDGSMDDSPKRKTGKSEDFYVFDNTDLPGGLVSFQGTEDIISNKQDIEIMKKSQTDKSLESSKFELITEPYQVFKTFQNKEETGERSHSEDKLNVLAKCSKYEAFTDKNSSVLGSSNNDFSNQSNVVSIENLSSDFEVIENVTYDFIDDHHVEFVEQNLLLDTVAKSRSREQIVSKSDYFSTDNEHRDLKDFDTSISMDASDEHCTHGRQEVCNYDNEKQMKSGWFVWKNDEFESSTTGEFENTKDGQTVLIAEQSSHKENENLQENILKKQVTRKPRPGTFIIHRDENENDPDLELRRQDTLNKESIVSKQHTFMVESNTAELETLDNERPMTMANGSSCEILEDSQAQDSVEKETLVRTPRPGTFVIYKEEHKKGNKQENVNLGRTVLQSTPAEREATEGKITLSTAESSYSREGELQDTVGTESVTRKPRPGTYIIHNKEAKRKSEQEEKLKDGLQEAFQSKRSTFVLCKEDIGQQNNRNCRRSHELKEPLSTETKDNSEFMDEETEAIQSASSNFYQSCERNFQNQYVRLDSARKGTRTRSPRPGTYTLEKQVTHEQKDENLEGFYHLESQVRAVEKKDTTQALISSDGYITVGSEGSWDGGDGDNRPIAKNDTKLHEISVITKPLSKFQTVSDVRYIPMEQETKAKPAGHGNFKNDKITMGDKERDTIKHTGDSRSETIEAENKGLSAMVGSDNVESDDVESDDGGNMQTRVVRPGTYILNEPTSFASKATIDSVVNYDTGGYSIVSEKEKDVEMVRRIDKVDTRKPNAKLDRRSDKVDTRKPNVELDCRIDKVDTRKQNIELDRRTDKVDTRKPNVELDCRIDKVDTTVKIAESKATETHAHGKAEDDVYTSVGTVATTRDMQRSLHDDRDVGHAKKRNLCLEKQHIDNGRIFEMNTMVDTLDNHENDFEISDEVEMKLSENESYEGTSDSFRVLKTEGVISGMHDFTTARSTRDALALKSVMKRTQRTEDYNEEFIDVGVSIKKTNEDISNVNNSNKLNRDDDALSNSVCLYKIDGEISKTEGAVMIENHLFNCSINKGGNVNTTGVNLEARPAVGEIDEIATDNERYVFQENAVEAFKTGTCKQASKDSITIIDEAIIGDKSDNSIGVSPSEIAPDLLTCPSRKFDSEELKDWNRAELCRHESDNGEIDYGSAEFVVDSIYTESKDTSLSTSNDDFYAKEKHNDNLCLDGQGFSSLVTQTIDRDDEQKRSEIDRQSLGIKFVIGLDEKEAKIKSPPEHVKRRLSGKQKTKRNPRPGTFVLSSPTLERGIYDVCNISNEMNSDVSESKRGDACPAGYLISDDDFNRNKENYVEDIVKDHTFSDSNSSRVPETSVKPQPDFKSEELFIAATKNIKRPGTFVISSSERSAATITDKESLDNSLLSRMEIEASLSADGEKPRQDNRVCKRQGSKESCKASKGESSQTDMKETGRKEIKKEQFEKFRRSFENQKPGLFIDFNSNDAELNIDEIENIDSASKNFTNIELSANESDTVFMEQTKGPIQGISKDGQNICKEMPADSIPEKHGMPKDANVETDESRYRKTDRGQWVLSVDAETEVLKKISSIGVTDSEHLLGSREAFQATQGLHVDPENEKNLQKLSKNIMDSQDGGQQLQGFQEVQERQNSEHNECSVQYIQTGIKEAQGTQNFHSNMQSTQGYDSFIRDPKGFQSDIQDPQGFQDAQGFQNDTHDAKVFQSDNQDAHGFENDIDDAQGLQSDARNAKGFQLTNSASEIVPTATIDSPRRRSEYFVIENEPTTSPRPRKNRKKSKELTEENKNITVSGENTKLKLSRKGTFVIRRYSNESGASKDSDRDIDNSNARTDKKAVSVGDHEVEDIFDNEVEEEAADEDVECEEIKTDSTSSLESLASERDGVLEETEMRNGLIKEVFSDDDEIRAGSSILENTSFDTRTPDNIEKELIVKANDMDVSTEYDRNGLIKEVFSDDDEIRAGSSILENIENTSYDTRTPENIEKELIVKANDTDVSIEYDSAINVVLQSKDIDRNEPQASEEGNANLESQKHTFRATEPLTSSSNNKLLYEVTANSNQPISADKPCGDDGINNTFDIEIKQEYPGSFAVGNKLEIVDRGKVFSSPCQDENEANLESSSVTEIRNFDADVRKDKIINSESSLPKNEKEAILFSTTNSGFVMAVNTSLVKAVFDRHLSEPGTILSQPPSHSKLATKEPRIDVNDNDMLSVRVVNRQLSENSGLENVQQDAIKSTLTPSLLSSSLPSLESDLIMNPFQLTKSRKRQSRGPRPMSHHVTGEPLLQRLQKLRSIMSKSLTKLNAMEDDSEIFTQVDEEKGKEEMFVRKRAATLDDTKGTIGEKPDVNSTQNLINDNGLSSGQHADNTPSLDIHPEVSEETEERPVSKMYEKFEITFDQSPSMNLSYEYQKKAAELASVRLRESPRSASRRKSINSVDKSLHSQQESKPEAFTEDKTQSKRSTYVISQNINSGDGEFKEDSLDKRKSTTQESKPEALTEEKAQSKRSTYVISRNINTGHGGDSLDKRESTKNHDGQSLDVSKESSIANTEDFTGNERLEISTENAKTKGKRSTYVICSNEKIAEGDSSTNSGKVHLNSGEAHSDSGNAIINLRDSNETNESTKSKPNRSTYIISKVGDTSLENQSLTQGERNVKSERKSQQRQPPSDVLDTSKNKRAAPCDRRKRVNHKRKDESTGKSPREPLAPRLAILKMQLEERRRYIEEEKKRMVEQWNDERLRVGQQAFWFAVGGKESRTEDGKQPIKSSDDEATEQSSKKPGLVFFPFSDENDPKKIPQNKKPKTVRSESPPNECSTPVTRVPPQSEKERITSYEGNYTVHENRIGSQGDDYTVNFNRIGSQTMLESSTVHEQGITYIIERHMDGSIVTVDDKGDQVFYDDYHNVPNYVKRALQKETGRNKVSSSGSERYSGDPNKPQNSPRVISSVGSPRSRKNTQENQNIDLRHERQHDDRPPHRTAWNDPVKLSARDFPSSVVSNIENSETESFIPEPETHFYYEESSGKVYRRSSDEGLPDHLLHARRAMKLVSEELQNEPVSYNSRRQERQFDSGQVLPPDSWDLASAGAQKKKSPREEDAYSRRGISVEFATKNDIDTRSPYVANESKSSRPKKNKTPRAGKDSRPYGSVEYPTEIDQPVDSRTHVSDGIVVGLNEETTEKNVSPRNNNIVIGKVGEEIASPAELTPDQIKKRERFMQNRLKRQQEEKAKKEAEIEKRKRKEAKMRERKASMEKRENEARRIQQEDEMLRKNDEQPWRVHDGVRDDERPTQHQKPRVQLSGNNNGIHGNIRHIGNETYNQPSPVQSTLTEYRGPPVYVKPSGKSNRQLMINAITHCCLSGEVNKEAKEKSLQVLSLSNATHFFALFREGLKFRGLYSYVQEVDEAHKIYGVGPKVISNQMIEKLYKYSSGGKSFSQIPAKSLSIQIDGIIIKKECWQSSKSSSLPSKTDSNLKKVQTYASRSEMLKKGSPKTSRR